MSESRNAATEDYALCIVGAGIAGLNVLAVAAEYLARGERVLLVDRKPARGGMWTETYDYVRLHQPYQRFTAADIPWALGEPPRYLATREEVLGHFDHCLSLLREKVTLEERYGLTYLDHTEHPSASGTSVDIRLAQGDGTPVSVRARRLVKAFGFRIERNDALPLSSDQVHSVSPHADALFGDAMAASDAPVFVVGGGKTAMDTAHALVTRYPDKAVHLLVGKGTVFSNRNKAFPKGITRWWAGHTGLDQTLDIALRYDGDNEAEVIDYFRRRYGISLGEDYTQYLFGLLSEEENQTIKEGVASIAKGYLRDVETRSGTPTLVMADGSTQAVPEGTWFVNCTGYVIKEDHPYEPYISQGGAVASVQPTSAIHFLTTFSAYFLTHLLYLDKLGTLPLYEMNYQALAGKNKVAFAPVGLTHSLYNTLLIIGSTPGSVIRDCGLDFDRWFPMLRKIRGGLRLKREGPQIAERLRHTLDRVRERYELECGVLATVSERSKAA